MLGFDIYIGQTKIVVVLVKRGEKNIVYFDCIDNLCAQSEKLAGADTVVEVARKNLLPVYQGQLAAAEAFNNLGGRRVRWDYQ